MVNKEDVWMNGVLTGTHGAQGCEMSLGAVNKFFARSVQETVLNTINKL